MAAMVADEAGEGQLVELRTSPVPSRRPGVFGQGPAKLRPLKVPVGRSMRA